MKENSLKMNQKLSIVTTFYQSTGNVNVFLSDVDRLASKLKSNFSDIELIVVDDGSTDDSWEKLIKFQLKNVKSRYFKLSRNFGHHFAILEGLSKASGDIVFLVDSDLEEDVNWLISFLEIMLTKNADVVFGVQEKRRGNFVEKITGELFYFFISRISDFPIARNTVTARLMNRQFVDAILSYGEKSVNIAAIWSSLGFQQEAFQVNKKRLHKSHYNLSKKISTAIDAATSFSLKPLLLIIKLGSLISLLSIVSVIFLISRKLIYGIQIEGWTSLMLAVLFSLGINMLAIGAVSVYISKIYIEVKNRPRALITDIYES